MEGWHIPTCEGAWEVDAQGFAYCVGDAASMEIPLSIQAFDISQLEMETLATMFGLGFTMVGSILVAGLVVGVVLRAIAR